MAALADHAIDQHVRHAAPEALSRRFAARSRAGATRPGFLDGIERGDIAWRPCESPAINALRIGLVVAEARTPTAPARQRTRRLAEELGTLRGTGDRRPH
jgi:hypothetical protein